MTDRLHFAARRGTPTPRLHHAWARLAAAAQALLADRQAKLPMAVANGTVPADDAARRIATMQAVVAQYQIVLDGTALPHPCDYADTLGADAATMLDDLRRTRDRGRARADRQPGDVAARDMADCLDALAYNQAPIADGALFPRLWVEHDHVMWLANRLTAHMHADRAA